MMHLKRSFFLILSLTVSAVTVFAVTPQAQETIDLNALYQQIDDAIRQSPQYVEERESKISACRDELLKENSLEESVMIAEELFLLYQPYRNDSALYYAELCISLADSLQRPDLVGRFRSMLAYQCSNVDLYNESLEQLLMINNSELDKRGLGDYYHAWMHVYGELAHYSQRKDIRERYFNLQNQYRDSVLMVADKDSEHYLHLKLDILCARRQFQDALRVSDKWLRRVEDDTHESSYAAFYRSMIYDNLKNHDMVCYWLGKSALEDIRCAVMNQASLLFLAEHLAEDGDISRASRYTEFSKKCNLFFYPRLRTYQVNSVINVIEKRYQANQVRTNTILMIASIVIVLLLMALVYTILRLRRRNIK